ncbi:MAG TPA: glycosyltransferase [Pseudomonadales bacterium]|nr:glycosyltransferase [Pseudomonadales bacterium]
MSVPATDMPLVSVIVPCYNHATFVATCLESILAQDYPAIEIIVIDDGSPDNSFTIASQFAGQRGLQLLQQENRGFIATINRGLAMATGEYYCIFASDDYMLPGRIGKQVAFLQQHPGIAACGGNVDEVDSEGKVTASVRRQSRELDFDDVFLGRQHGIPAPTAMIRTAAAQAVGGYPADIGIEDLYMWLKLTHAGWRLAVLDDVFACYRKSPASLHQRHLYMLEHKLRIFHDYAGHPAFARVRDRAVLGSFLRAARAGAPDARKIWRHYQGSWFNRKLWRGFFYMLSR